MLRTLFACHYLQKMMAGDKGPMKGEIFRIKCRNIDRSGWNIVYPKSHKILKS